MRRPRWIYTIPLRLRSLFRRAQVEQELDEELRYHLERQVNENIAKGMTADEARHAALLAMGGVERRKEECRDTRRVKLIEDLMQDLYYGVRTLRKSPGFTAVAVLTLTLGIGATTALYSLFNALLFRPLPFHDPDRLVRIYKTIPQSQVWPHPPAHYLDYKLQNKVFVSMAAFYNNGFDLAEAGQPPEHVHGMNVSADFFPILGVEPLMGRVFRADEDQPGRNQVIVLSHDLWRNRFAGDPHIVGRTLRDSGEAVTVLGVMPAGFDHAPLWWNKVEAWRPLALTDEQRRERKLNSVNVLARLNPGVSLAQAQAEMSAIAARLAQEHFEHNCSVRVTPLKGSVTGDTGQRIAFFTLGLSGFVLLIACANLAHLQMVRATGRAREYVIRAALGAKRSRLIRQSLTESLLLALIGGALGLLLAVWGSGYVGRHVIINNQVGIAIPIDSAVMIFSLLVTLLTGVAFGATPAWIGSRVDLNEALKQGNRGTTAHHSHHRLRHWLIAAEVALALVSLAGAGLFVNGLYRFTHSDPGWRVENLLKGYLILPDKKYSTVDSRRSYYQKLQTRLTTLPGVAHVALSTRLPLDAFPIKGGFIVAGQPEPPRGDEPVLSINQVSSGYFATLGMRLIEGRDFTTADINDASTAVIINETTARRFWPGESAIGKRFRYLDSEIAWQEIVGVVSDVHYASSVLSKPFTPYQVYEPLDREAFNFAAITLSGAAPPEAFTNSVRRVVAEIDPDQPVSQLEPAQRAVERGIASLSLLGSILMGFSFLGLLLAALGIYGVMSGFVVQRTYEIGIRVAMGAQTRDVIWLVLGKGLRLTLMGSGIGIIGAIGIGRLLTAALPRLPARDPWSIVLVAALLIVVALVACWLPAHRAAKTDPMTALRHD